jgi:hypothetical protein
MYRAEGRRFLERPQGPGLLPENDVQFTPGANPVAAYGLLAPGRRFLVLCQPLQVCPVRVSVIVITRFAIVISCFGIVITAAPR